MSHLGRVQSQWPSWDPASHPKRTLMENSGLENKASEISFKSDRLFPAGKWRGSSKSPLLPHYYLSICLFYHHHYLLTFITCFSHATFVAVVLSLSHVWLFATPRTQNARLPCLYLPEFVQTHVHWVHTQWILFNHLILCRPLLLLPSIFPSIRVFSNESALCIKWPKYWSFNFSWMPPTWLHYLI